MKNKKKYNIAIVGLGNIGLSLYKHLVKNRKNIIEKNNVNFDIKYVSELVSSDREESGFGSTG